VFFPSPQHRRWTSADPWYKRHGLSLVLGSILIVQSVAYWFTRYPSWVDEERRHGVTSPAVWPDFVLHYSSEYLVSILADTYGAVLLVVFTKWFYETGSKESNDRGDG
jgi:hypothetical protein